MRDRRFTDLEASPGNPQPEADTVARVTQVARAVACGDPDPDRLTNGAQALQGRAWDTYFGAVADAVRADASRRAAWAEPLARRVLELCFDFDALAKPRGEADALRAAASYWRQERNPWSAWSHRSEHLHYWGDDGLHYANWLLWMSPSDGAHLLDKLPFPGMMHTAMVVPRNIAQDREMILRLVEEAPVAFDNRGSWNASRPVAALLAAKAVVEHAETLHRTVELSSRTADSEELRTLQEHEIPSWFQEAFEHLADRPDGSVIGRGLLTYVARIRLSVGGPPSEWSINDAACRSLAAVLGRRGCSVAGVRAIWRQSEALATEVAQAPRPYPVVSSKAVTKSDRDAEGARGLYSEGLPALFAAAVILGNGSPVETEIFELWTWLADLLLGRDPGLTLATYGDSMSRVPQLLGTLFAGLSDPAAAVLDLYRRLEPQRRRAQFWGRYKDDTDVALPSILLLRIALYAAADWRRRLADDEAAAAASLLFFWVYEAALRLWLTSPHDVEHPAAKLVADCFAFIPATFGDELEATVVEMVPAIANHPRMLCDAAVSLVLHGIDAGRVKAAFLAAGANVDSALAAVRQWAKLSGNSRELPRDLGLLEATSTAPDGEGASE